MAKHTLNYTGVELDKLLGSIGDKYGYLATSSGTDASSYYHLYTFASKAKWDEWVASGSDTEKIDPETGKKYILQDMAIPISTIEGASYAATLDIDTSIIPATANIVLDKDSLIVPVRYRSLKADPTLGRINAGISGKVEVQRKTVGDWTTVGTLKEELISKDETDLTFVNIDLGEFLANGNQEIRLQAMYTYVDEEGATRTVRSSAVMVGRTITRTNLRLELVTDFHRPMEAFDKETGLKKNFGVEYTMFGDCDKTLKVTIEGSIKEGDAFKSKSIESKSGVISIPEESAYLFLEHGVRKVTAWIEAPDGLGNTLYSNTSVNSFMVVNRKSSNYDVNKKYLLVQNKLDSVTNFIQSDIMSYAVYSEDVEAETELKFSLTDASNNSYVDIMAVAKSNTPYTLSSTIEIESSNEANPPTEYRTRLYVFRDGDNNFIEESDIHDSKFFSLIVDNSEAIVPISGADFLLNPKNRSNDIEPFKIFNAAKNNTPVDAIFSNFGLTNDLWTVDDYGYKCLRVLAGQTLNIKRNIWAQFLKTPNSSMTIDIDFRVRNITNTELPIVQIAGSSTGNGIVMNPLVGWLRAKSSERLDDCMFSWREDERQFLSVNINHNVKPKRGDGKDVIYPVESEVTSNESLALARVLLNGDPVREVSFNKNDKNEWCDDENASIIIGSEGADIDIYSIRVYEDKSLDWIDLLNKNYLASIPSTEEKFTIKRKNDLYDVNEGRITLEKARAAGLNCIVYHGQRPYVKDKNDKYKGYIEYFRYDNNGNELKEYSGTNCRKTESMNWKGQGSTAKTYYEWNIQDDNSKIKFKFSDGIWVSRKDFHESFELGEPYEGTAEDANKDTYNGWVIKLKGGNLGKNFPVDEEPVAYPYNPETDEIQVPDGWVDGNGKYRGSGYMVAEGTALAQKKVAKINYASAMQSHLLGACKSYDELHFKVVGATPMQQQAISNGKPRPVSAKHVEPFLMFWQKENEPAYYTGLCVYGAGKMDKVSWGYTKKKHKMFSLIEGSDNNLPMTDFRIPFDKNTVVYDCGAEYWGYTTWNSKGEEQLDGSWDFDGGATVGYSPENDGDDSIITQMSEGWKFKFTDIEPAKIEEEAEAPTAKIRDNWAMKHNFIYLNSTNLKFFDGTFEKFKQSTAANDFNSKYWCTSFSQDGPLYLYRYDFYKKEWIHAGLLDESTTPYTYKPIDLATDIRTKATFEKYKKSADFEKMNESFKTDMASFMKKYGELFINLGSLTFNYSYVLSFLAGTDNSSKNTYFKTDPIAQDKSSIVDDKIDTWLRLHFGNENIGEDKTLDYTKIYQIYLDGDDMDSILPVNNKGNMTKPYYLERKYPCREGSTESLYEGMDNQLFNFVEIAYSDIERSSTMNAILTGTNELMADVKKEELLGYSGSPVSAWGFLHKYFFNVQYYFPQIAYIEQARIRYEFAELIGNPEAARGVLPITQSIGSQVKNEQQFMEQRLVYMASFAGYGSLGNSKGSIGIADAEDRLSFQCYGSQEKPETISLMLKPYQYIYPYGLNGQSFRQTLQRVSPHETCVLTLADSVQKLTDTTLVVNGINYYKSIGNVGNTAIYSTNFQIVGKRITEFVSEPTREDAPFKALSITVKSPLIERFSLKGSKNIAKDDGTPIQTLNLTSLTRCKEIDTRGAKFSEVALPQSTLLEKVYLGSEITKFAVEIVPNLKELSFEGYQNISSFVVGDNVGPIDTLRFVTRMKGTPSPISTLSIHGIHWEGVEPSLMEWAAEIPKSTLSGYVKIAPSNILNFEQKRKILYKFGNIDSYDNTLYIEYEIRPLTSIALSGNTNLRDAGNYYYKVIPDNSFGNDYNNVEWRLNPSDTRAVIDQNGILTINKLYSEAENVSVDIVCSIKKMDGSILSKSINVKLYRRSPKVGDYLFSDASFDNTLDGGKIFCAVCFYVEDMGEFWDARFISKEYKNISNRTPWGLNPTSIPDVSLKDDPSYDCYNIASLKDINYAGIGKITTSNYTEDTGEGYAYKLFSSNDGVGYGVKNTDGLGISKFGLEKVGNFSTYMSEDEDTLVPIGRADTVRIIQHRNKLLNELGIAPPSDNGEVSEEQDLSNKVVQFTSDAGDNKYAQFFYPQASLCYSYQPKAGNVSNELKAHKWYYASTGEMARILYLKYHLAPNVDGTNGIFAEVMNAEIFESFKETSASTETTSKLDNNGLWTVFADRITITHYNKASNLSVRPAVALRIPK